VSESRSGPGQRSRRDARISGRAEPLWRTRGEAPEVFPSRVSARLPSGAGSYRGKKGSRPTVSGRKAASAPIYPQTLAMSRVKNASLGVTASADAVTANPEDRLKVCGNRAARRGRGGTQQAGSGQGAEPAAHLAGPGAAAGAAPGRGRTNTIGRVQERGGRSGRSPPRFAPDGRVLAPSFIRRRKRAAAGGPGTKTKAPEVYAEKARRQPEKPGNSGQRVGGVATFRVRLRPSGIRRAQPGEFWTRAGRGSAQEPRVAVSRAAPAISREGPTESRSPSTGARRT